MTNLTRGLETKPVFDWDNRPVGTILGSELDPKTHDPRSLIIGLSSDARDLLGVDKETIELPFDYVFGIRRDQVRLSRGMQELAPDLQLPEPLDEMETSRIIEASPKA